MDSPSFAHYAVLTHASEASPLWEVLWPTTSYDASGTKFEVLPALPLLDAQAALRDLVTSSAVSLYEEPDDSSNLLSQEEASSAIDDEANWRPPADSGRSVWYSLAVTDSGDEILARAVELYGGQTRH